MNLQQFRTMLRRNLPWRFSQMISKSSRKCKVHEWYNYNNEVDHCYHCEPGERARLEKPSECWNPQIGKSAYEANRMQLMLLSKLQIEQRFANLYALCDDFSEELLLALAVLATRDDESGLRAIGFDLLKVLSEHDPTARFLLLEQIDNIRPTESKLNVLWSMAHALNGIRVRGALSRIVSLSEVPDADVRWQVADAIPQVIDDDRKIGIGVLIALCEDQDVEVRRHAVKHLALFISADDDRVRESLRSKLNDSDAEVVRQAKHALGMT